MPEASVIIIGAGIGGLSAGALLAKRGFKVRLFEQAPRPGGLCGYFSKNGYVFQSTAHFYSGFDLGGGHEQLLGQLNLNLKKNRLEPGLQVILPNHRINIMPDRAGIYEELKREFPDSIAAIKGLAESLDQLGETFFQLQRQPGFRCPDGLIEKYKFSKEITAGLAKAYPNYEASPELKNRLNDPEAEAFFNALSFHYAQLAASDCSALYCAYLLSILRRGFYYLKGGGQQLIDALTNYILQHNGQVTFQSRVESLLLDGKKVRGVRLADGQEHRTDYVVANTTVHNLQHWLSGSYLGQKLSDRVEEAAPQWAAFSVYLGVDEAVLPDELRENILLLSDYNKPLGGTNNLSITVSPASDPSRAPKGKRAVTITCCIPKSDWQRNGDYAARKQQLTEEVITAASSLIVFLREGIDYQDAATPLTYQNFTGRAQGMITGLAATESGFGFKGCGNITPCSNLFLVGDTCFPGSGTSLVSLSAMNAVKCICG